VKNDNLRMQSYITHIQLLNCLWEFLSPIRGIFSILSGINALDVVSMYFTRVTKKFSQYKNYVF